MLVGMRNKALLLLGCLLFALVIASCVGPFEAGIDATVEARVEEALEVTCDQFLGDKHFTWNVQVQLGDSLLVTLCSNPTTGFQWSESARISDESILEQMDHSFTPPEEGTPGAAGKEEWSLKALKKGTSTVLLEYSRPWEGGEKGEWSLTATVVVD
jgi:inhibitor of cysteine peptidase